YASVTCAGTIIRSMSFPICPLASNKRKWYHMDVEGEHLWNMQKIPDHFVLNIGFLQELLMNFSEGNRQASAAWFLLFEECVHCMISLHQAVLSGNSLSPVAVNQSW
ncbi:hypothetical protein NPIL_401701, partial [Nephila pilipes]